MSAYPVITSSFEASFRASNPGLAQGFKHWLFYEAMLFDASHTWWQYSGMRDRPHEGVDLSLYRDGPGRCRRLNHGTRIPVILDGMVVKIFRDFLGQSLYMSHELGDGKGRRLYSFYGHIKSLPGVGPGRRMKEGEVVGMIADPKMDKKTIHPHLHLSIAWVPDTFSSDRLDWETMVTEKEIVLLDPLKVLDLEHEIIPRGSCRD